MKTLCDLIDTNHFKITHDGDNGLFLLPFSVWQEDDALAVAELFRSQPSGSYTTHCSNKLFLNRLIRRHWSEVRCMEVQRAINFVGSKYSYYDAGRTVYHFPNVTEDIVLTAMMSDNFVNDELLTDFCRDTIELKQPPFPKPVRNRRSRFIGILSAFKGWFSR